ncbi:hypothetical protein J4401_02705 [Candidatus Woesearchaeota archaeon]|nr:hypothetical protein [Candidatus Woesearchaeota archaeon]
MKSEESLKRSTLRIGDMFRKLLATGIGVFIFGFLLIMVGAGTLFYIAFTDVKYAKFLGTTLNLNNIAAITIVLGLMYFISGIIIGVLTWFMRKR